MSSEVFPTLPGQKIERSRAAQWDTQIRKSVSGKELRLALMASPRWRYKVSFDVLREAAGYDELRQVVGLFNKCRGAWDNLLLLDPKDHVATAARFGTGDGIVTQFRLARDYGGFVEPVEAPKGAAVIYKDGMLQAQPGDCSVTADGWVSFVTAPAPGTALTWTGEFYWRVRFLRDEAEFDEFLDDLWRSGKIELLTVKGELP